MAIEEGVQVAGEGAGVGGRAVDVGGGAGPQYRHAEEIKSRGAGDDAAVVADVAGAVTDGEVEPGMVRPEAGRPEHRGDLSAGEVQLQRGTGIDPCGCEPVRGRQLMVPARPRPPLGGPG